MREIFDRIRVPLHQKREISELEQMREISGPCKSILPTHASNVNVVLFCEPLRPESMF